MVYPKAHTLHPNPEMGSCAASWLQQLVLRLEDVGCRVSCIGSRALCTLGSGSRVWVMVVMFWASGLRWRLWGFGQP